MIATSYTIEETDRTFKSEYIVSQSVMLACKKLGLDGVAYHSKRVVDDAFTLAACNLALFANYKKGSEYGDVCRQIKVGEPMNYQFFKQLGLTMPLHKYHLRILDAPESAVIGSSNRNYQYCYTEFCHFDEHLFDSWTDKDSAIWGNALE